MTLTELHKRLLNDFQRDFPLSPAPYRDIARRLAVSEAQVLDAFAELNAGRLISRIGAVVPPNHIGVSTLAAMAVPEERLEAVAAIVSACPEVNHNYEREHRLNLWFVVVAADAPRLQAVIDAITRQAGLEVLQLPLLDEFFIDLGFDLGFERGLRHG